MTDKERIEILEQQVSFLTKQLSFKNSVKPWHSFSSFIDAELSNVFNGDNFKSYRVKDAITGILNKSFDTSVVMLNLEQIEKSKPIVNEIINFIKEQQEGMIK